MNSKVLNVIKTTAEIGILVTAYAIGAGIIPIKLDLSHKTETVSAAASQPDHFPTVEAKLVETHTTKYVKETVVDTHYVDVVKEVPVRLRNFTGLTELENWVNQTLNASTVRFSSQDSIIDCDDYAVELQQKALQDGYIISFQIINRTDYNKLFATQLPDGQSLHAIDLAIIGNSVFYIEPQTGEVVFAAYLD